MDSIGAPKRVPPTKPGHKPEHCVSNRHLSELFPIVAEAAPELLELGGQ